MKAKKTFNVHEAKTHFSKLIARAAKGEELVIAKGGKPVARLIPFARPGKRQLGVDRGKFAVPDDFNAPLPDELMAYFDGRR